MVESLEQVDFEADVDRLVQQSQGGFRLRSSVLESHHAKFDEGSGEEQDELDLEQIRVEESKQKQTKKKKKK